jgi:hypothetical protein
MRRLFFAIAGIKPQRMRRRFDENKRSSISRFEVGNSPSLALHECDDVALHECDGFVSSIGRGSGRF